MHRNSEVRRWEVQRARKGLARPWAATKMDDAPCVQPEDSVWQHLSGGASWSVSCNVIRVPFSALYLALTAFCFGARYRRLAILRAWKLSWLGTTFCTKILATSWPNYQSASKPTP